MLKSKDENKDSKSSLHLGRWTLVILVLPVVLIFLIALILKWLVENVHVSYVVLLFDLSESMSTSDYIGLYAAFAGIGATVFLGFAIYRMGVHREEKRVEDEIKSKRDYLVGIIEMNLKKVYARFIDTHLIYKQSIAQIGKVSGIHLPDGWERIVQEVEPCLSDSTYETIYDLLVAFHKWEDSSEDIRRFIFQHTMPLFTRDYIDDFPFNIDVKPKYQDVISYKLHKTLTELKGMTNSQTRICKYSETKMFYEETNENDEPKYRVAKPNGEVLIDAVFHDDGTYTGFMTIYRENKIEKQGEFEKSKQISGYHYKALCTANGKWIRDFTKHVKRQIEEIEYNTEETKRGSEPTLYRRLGDFIFENGQPKLIDGSMKYVEIYLQ